MTTHIDNYRENAKGHPSLHKKIGGEEFFWCGKYKRKAGVLRHLTVVAGNTGYNYRVEKICDVSNLTLNKTIRYNLWCRKR